MNEGKEINAEPKRLTLVETTKLLRVLIAAFFETVNANNIAIVDVKGLLISLICNIVCQLDIPDDERENYNKRFLSSLESAMQMVTNSEMKAKKEPKEPSNAKREKMGNYFVVQLDEGE